MKKKKLPLWGALILLAMYLLFGTGGEGAPEAVQTEPIQTVSVLLDETQPLPPETNAPEATEPETETPPTEALPPETTQPNPRLDPEGSYTTKEDVALYIQLYGELPGNFITKNEARDLGWDGGSLEDYAPGMCIGGDRFGNYEGLLPDAAGRRWTECDIDTLGRNSRGAKRIVFSNDGLIYYTDDHYESFELLYGEP